MNNEFNDLLKDLRKLNNEQRLSWILKNYSTENVGYSYVFNIIPHFSWGKKEKKLMEYYLEKLPFASEKPYEAFLKVSPLREFLHALSQIVLSRRGEDLSLLHYHLTWVFKKYMIIDNGSNEEVINEFMGLLEEPVSKTGQTKT